MLRSVLRTVALAAVVLPGAAMAQNLHDSYVQGAWAFYPDADPGSQDYLGLDAEARLGLTEEFFLLGGFQYLSDDVDYSTFHGGGALRIGVDARTDVWGGATVEYQEFDPGRSDTSIGLRGGVRHRLNDALALEGSVRVVTGDADYVGVRGTAVYNIRPGLALSGAVDVRDGDPGFIGGARFRF